MGNEPGKTDRQRPEGLMSHTEFRVCPEGLVDLSSCQWEERGQVKVELASGPQHMSLHHSCIGQDSLGYVRGNGSMLKG